MHLCNFDLSIVKLLWNKTKITRFLRSSTILTTWSLNGPGCGFSELFWLKLMNGVFIPLLEFYSSQFIPLRAFLDHFYLIWPHSLCLQSIPYFFIETCNIYAGKCFYACWSSVDSQILGRSSKFLSFLILMAEHQRVWKSWCVLCFQSMCHHIGNSWHSFNRAYCG